MAVNVKETEMVSEPLLSLTMDEVSFLRYNTYMHIVNHNNTMNPNRLVKQWGPDRELKDVNKALNN